MTYDASGPPAPRFSAGYFQSSHICRRIDQAIELIEHYLNNKEDRVRIAKAGFERYWQDYEAEGNLLNLLNWAVGLQKKNSQDRNDGEQ